MSVEEKIKQIIKDQLGVSEEEVKPEASFVEDLGADSLDLTELIMAMEEEFGVEIADEDAQKILKVKDAINYIESSKSKTGHGCTPFRGRPASREESASGSFSCMVVRFFFVAARPVPGRASVHTVHSEQGADMERRRVVITGISAITLWVLMLQAAGMLCWRASPVLTESRFLILPDMTLRLPAR